MATAIADIEVIPLSEACGAEIRGVDLNKPLDGKTQNRSSRRGTIIW